MSIFNALRKGLGLALAASALVIGSGARSDEVLVGHLSVVPVENIKAAVPHKVKLSDKKPTSITVEPTYRGTPMYGAITLGSSKKARIPVVLDTFPGDKLPRLYVDLTGSGDITGKASFFFMKPLMQFAIEKPGEPPASVSNPQGVGLPIGAMAATVARYDIKGVTQEVKCPVLFTIFGDELDYTICVQHLGALDVGGKSIRIALVDANANDVFDNYAHADDKPATVNLMIDRNDDGRFDPVKERFDLAKPFRVAGLAYEVASVDPEGTIIALQPTTKRPEGGISADELAIGTDSIDFISKVMDGRTVSVPSSYKHQVVLLDFWATSNPVCIAEAPNIVAVYNQYHAAGFTVLGISLDKADMANEVKSFCAQMGMTWPEIYDGLRWNTEAAKLYGVDSVPRLFLIDGDSGTILGLGDGLRGAGLQPAVVKALEKKAMLKRR